MRVAGIANGGVIYGPPLWPGCEILIGGGGVLRLRQSAEFVGGRDQRGPSTVSVAGGQLRAGTRSSHRPQDGKQRHHLTRGGQIGDIDTSQRGSAGVRPRQFREIIAIPGFDLVAEQRRAGG